MDYSLQRKAKSPYFFCYFRVPDPNRPGEKKQVSRSTKCTQRAEANKRALQIVEAALKDAGADSEKSSRLHDAIRKAGDLALTGGLNEPTARLFLKELYEIANGSKLDTYTIEGWFQQWLADQKKSVRSSTYDSYRAHVNHFLASLSAERKDCDLMTLTTSEIKTFQTRQAESGKIGATVNTSITTIRSALKQAVEANLLLSNPAVGVKALEKTDFEKATFEPADIAKLLKQACDEWKGLILVGFYVGASLHDAANLRWNQIDLAKSVVVYKRAKLRNAKAIEVPIHDELHRWLMSLPASDDPEAFVFPSLAGKRTSGRNGLSCQFKQLMKQAKLTGKEIAPEQPEGAKSSKGRTRSNLTFHSLRHSFNSILANSGVAAEIRQKLVGHSSAKMNARYTHLEDAIYRAAVNTVPSIEEEPG